MKNNKKKLCFAASSGGHYEQLMMLEPLMIKYDSFIVTEKTQYKTAIKNKKMYFMLQTNRKEKSFILRLIVNAFKSLTIIIVENPDIIITTGVLAMIPLCLLAKFFNKKLIYIESFAKVSTSTETGRLMYRFADQFYVQWEPMLEVFPNAIYLGGIY